MTVHSVNDGPAALYVGWHGGQQVLVTVWQDGTAEVATRSDEHETWSPPSPLTKEED